MTIAVIFVPTAHLSATFANACLDYCASRGYEVAGLVTGNWNAAVEMLTTHAAGVLVVARQSHVDPDFEPRIEVVSQQPERPTRRTQRRSRLIRPPDAAE